MGAKKFEWQLNISDVTVNKVVQPELFEVFLAQMNSFEKDGVEKPYRSAVLKFLRKGIEAEMKERTKKEIQQVSMF